MNDVMILPKLSSLQIQSRKALLSPYSLLNIAAQWRSPDVKLFVIGFNKCGTTALDRFFRYQGMRCVHHGAAAAGCLAVKIEERVAHPESLRAYLAQWTVYSDLIFSSLDCEIEANRHFREFHRLFPKAYFILNDRDPERWLASRLAHDKGSFAKRSMAFHEVDREELMQIWRRRRDKHHEDVLAYFRGNEKFLHFKIDQDPISDVVKLVSPHFSLNGKHWRRIGVTV